MAAVRPPSAASCKRRVCAVVTRFASPTTAPRPRCRRPSSITASSSPSSRASAYSTRRGSSPAWYSPGANRSRVRTTHSTSPPIRAATPAMNSVAAASSPQWRPTPATSCNASIRSPPWASRSSSAATPNGSTGPSPVPPPSKARTVSRRSAMEGTGTDTVRLATAFVRALFHRCSNQVNAGLCRQPAPPSRSGTPAGQSSGGTTSGQNPCSGACSVEARRAGRTGRSPSIPTRIAAPAGVAS